jgi:hypothetical protein
MKKLLLITPFLLTVIAARADVVVIQKMESASVNGDVTMKIKGDKGRVDMPASAVSMIIDGASGEIATIIHSQKKVMKTTSAQMKAAAEQAKKITGVTTPEKPKATGKMEKVGEWNTEIYEANMGGQVARIWVAKDFPNADKIKAEMLKISKSMGQTLDIDSATMDVPGMAVKTEIVAQGGKMTMTVTKAVEQAVDAKEFEIPKDYQQMTLPGAPK